MNDIISRLYCKIASDRSRGRIQRIGLAHHRTGQLNDIVTLPYHRKYRTGRNELHELAEERSFLVFSVMVLRLLLCDLNQLRSDELKPFVLKALHDLAD